jgi:hypothetical protein
MEREFSEAQPQQERDADDSHCDSGQQVEQGIDDIDLCSGLIAVELFQHDTLHGAVLM